MTIFRFSAVAALLALVACAENMPAKKTELGKIVRMSNIDSAGLALGDFVRARLRDRTALRREFADAGFERTNFLDQRGRSCELFQWQGKPRGAAFSTLFRASICEDEVFARAWQNLP